jgi:hypothetical protein
MCPSVPPQAGHEGHPDDHCPPSHKWPRRRLQRPGAEDTRGSLLPDIDDIPRRRRVLVLDVPQAAAEVSRLVHEAYDLNLPGVRDGRNALVRWTVLLQEVLP